MASSPISASTSITALSTPTSVEPGQEEFAAPWRSLIDPWVRRCTSQSPSMPRSKRSEGSLCRRNLLAAPLGLGLLVSLSACSQTGVQATGDDELTGLWRMTSLEVGSESNLKEVPYSGQIAFTTDTPTGRRNRRRERAGSKCRAVRCLFGARYCMVCSISPTPRT